jgi:MFS family permease
MKSFFDDIVITSPSRWRSLLKEDIAKFYLSVFILQFAAALIGIFVPIYLYQIGYGIPQILVYFGIQIGVHISLIWFSAKLALKIGSARVNLLSIPFAIACNILLISLPAHPGLFLLIPVLIGIFSSLYWFSFHFYFSNLSFEADRSRKYGFVTIFMQSAALIGPLLGGLLITLFGMPVVFTLVAILFFLSALPLFFIKKLEHQEVLAWKELFAGFRPRKFFAYYGYGFQMFIDSYLFVIFMFLVVHEIFSIGFITTISEVGSILFVFIISSLSDRHPKRVILGIGAFAMSIFWAARAFLRNIWQVFVLNTLFKMAYTTVDIPMSAIYYNLAEKDRIARNILRREYGLHAGTLSAFIFLALLFTLSPYQQVNFMIAFFVGALMVLATLFF